MYFQLVKERLKKELCTAIKRGIFVEFVNQYSVFVIIIKILRTYINLIINFLSNPVCL